MLGRGNRQIGTMHCAGGDVELLASESKTELLQHVPRRNITWIMSGEKCRYF